MTNVPHPVIYAPTRANRAAILARLRTAGIHIAGLPMNYPLNDDWETSWGGSHHHIAYCLSHQGVVMLSAPNGLANHPILTIVNSPDHFISYVRRHKLPLAS